MGVLIVSLILSPEEIQQLTGYTQPARQLSELHRRGFVRAYRNRLGQVTLERAHYDAVARGEQAAPKPKVRLLATS